MNIVHQITKNCFQKKKINVLACPVHERTQSNMRNVDAAFFLVHCNNGKTWNNTYDKLPKNHVLIPRERGFWLPPEIEIDVAISGNKFDNFQTLKPFCDRFRIPLISIEHTAPYLGHWPKPYLDHLNSLKGDINLYITKYNQGAWGANYPSEIIEHGVDTETFKPHPGIEKKQYLLSVCNQFSRPERHLPCGFPLWKEVTEGLPKLHIGGDDPNFSEPAKDINELVYRYNECAVFINTSQISPIPTVMLEAAACGAAIVSTSNCAIPDIFTHGHDALLSNNPKELRQFCMELLNNPALRYRLGSNARQTILDRFGLDKFTARWNEVLRKASLIRK